MLLRPHFACSYPKIVQSKKLAFNYKKIDIQINLFEMVYDLLKISTNVIAQFRVAACLSFKASPGAQTIQMGMSCVFLCKSNSFSLQ